MATIVSRLASVVARREEMYTIGVTLARRKDQASWLIRLAPTLGLRGGRRASFWRVFPAVSIVRQ
jgi:hypothetical protein